MRLANLLILLIFYAIEGGKLFDLYRVSIFFTILYLVVAILRKSSLYRLPLFLLLIGHILLKVIVLI